ncbi:hypothetical protein [Marinobacter sp. F4216]|uniref:hypothetical protein n=1 Tax=Marinobacter sp. F4216 TaxID=2874281 RepID=UPI001CBF69C3|nr:hypothetical protein [Marinobacter sp. F4216]MBZ2168805.1 hypothetical protein [Marinobacter sp. F4216]
MDRGYREDSKDEVLRTSARLKDQAGVSHGAQDHTDDDPARAPSPPRALSRTGLPEHQTKDDLNQHSSTSPGRAS